MGQLIDYMQARGRSLALIDSLVALGRQCSSEIGDLERLVRSLNATIETLEIRLQNLHENDVPVRIRGAG